MRSMVCMWCGVVCVWCEWVGCRRGVCDAVCVVGVACALGMMWHVCGVTWGCTVRFVCMAWSVGYGWCVWFMCVLWQVCDSVCVCRIGKSAIPGPFWAAPHFLPPSSQRPADMALTQEPGHCHPSVLAQGTEVQSGWVGVSFHSPLPSLHCGSTHLACS